MGTEMKKYEAECRLLVPNNQWHWTPTASVNSLDEADDFFEEQLKSGKFLGKPGDIIEYVVELYNLESHGFNPDVKSVVRRVAVNGERGS